jgi:hypothetical protein
MIMPRENNFMEQNKYKNSDDFDHQVRVKGSPTASSGGNMSICILSSQTNAALLENGEPSLSSFAK